MPYSSNKRFLILSGCSLFLGVWVVVIAETFARVKAGEESISTATAECLHLSISQPIGTLLQLLPFAILGGVAYAFSSSHNLRRGWLILLSSLPLIIYHYFTSYIGGN